MSNRIEKGMDVLYQMGGQVGVDAMEKLKSISPTLAENAIAFGYGDIYDLEGLSKREKIVSSISTLIATGNTDALSFHMRAAFHSGFTKEDITSIILHTVPYLGFPSAIQATQVLEEVCDRLESE